MACTDNTCVMNLDDASIRELLDCPSGPVGTGRHAMGLGAIGDGKVIFKRKFRWTFEIEYCCNNTPPGGTLQPPKTVAKEFVKIGARPQIDIEEVEINYLNGKMWIPGKGTWQPMTVTYYDVAGLTSAGINGSAPAWIATIYDFTDCECLPMNSVPEQYEGVARLVLWDGCGNPLEAWLLRHVWPQSVNWGDLDMSSSEECTVELTLRYSDVSYRSFCPDLPFDKCPCGPCPTE